MESKKRSPRMKKSTPKPAPILDIIHPRMEKERSTVSFILKLNSKIDSVSKEVLHSLVLPKAAPTKFRNCAIYKFNIDETKICVKIFTNFTIQINGIKNKEDIIKVLNNPDINIEFKDYFGYCVLQNWSLRLSLDPIDLFATKNALNNLGVCAFFLRGYPLVIKKTVEFKTPKFNILSKDGLFTSIEDSKSSIGEEECILTMLLFSSGNCIVSGLSDEEVSKLTLLVKENIILKQNKK